MISRTSAKERARTAESPGDTRGSLRPDFQYLLPPRPIVSLRRRHEKRRAPTTFRNDSGQDNSVFEIRDRYRERVPGIVNIRAGTRQDVRCRG